MSYHFQPSAESSSTAGIANDARYTHSHAFLTFFHGEFLEASTLNFSFLSGADPNHPGIGNFFDENDVRRIVLEKPPSALLPNIKSIPMVYVGK
ncbi:hypothetical protein BDR03DRAFT_1005039 [Suillus americanus]|nr:hypothetical protein BDR03DRAFT_1005039 [Suillus americanus]